MSSPAWSGRRARALLVGVLALGVVLVAAGSAWLWLSQRRVDSADRDIAALKSKLAGRGGDADEHHRLGLHLCEHGGTAEGLAHLELAAEKAPADLRFGNAVRTYARRFEEYDRSIRFFEHLVVANGELPEPRVQLALAYVDKMPDHMMGIVGQGKLSKQSIALLNQVLDSPEPAMAESTRWAALYALGLNHLYWPKALRHAGAAEEALRRCLSFQKTMRDGDAPAYFMLPYLGLGDALVKLGRLSEARAVWREARQSFPEEPRLAERLALDDDERLTDLIDRVRGLGVAVDTDLTILWGRRP